MAKIYAVPEENIDNILKDVIKEDEDFQAKFGVYIGRLFSDGKTG